MPESQYQDFNPDLGKVNYGGKMKKLIMSLCLFLLFIGSSVNIFASSPSIPPNFEGDSSKKIIGSTNKFQIYEKAPVIIKRVQPKYPEYEINAEFEYAVTLEVEFFADGTVGAVEVKKSLMSGPGGLDESAIEAVRHWKFSPAISGGRPVAAWAIFDINFKINK